MPPKKPEETGTSLPFPSLQLMAPPVRLVSAALWKVMKQRDVMQYGTVEEFVTSACETVPGLLTYRHQGKLALGLRARLILELCHQQDQPDPLVISRHLQRIRSPAPPPSASQQKLKKDIKIERAVINFHKLMQMFLSNPARKDKFFKEVFLVEYGPQFDRELEKLLWEFLIRVDQLLPVPSLAQTVSWLSTSPIVLEECSRAASQPQLLNILLQHQNCLGHLDSAASLPPCMGDSILNSLSLPLSGRPPQTQSSEGPSCSTPMHNKSDKQPQYTSEFISPVMPLISNEDVPVMIKASTGQLLGTQPESALGNTREGPPPSGEKRFTRRMKKKEPNDTESKEEDEQVADKERVSRKSVMKRKQCEEGASDSEEEEQSCIPIRGGGKGTVSHQMCRKVQRIKDTKEDCEISLETGKSEREHERTLIAQMGLKKLTLPEDPALQSSLVSCLRRQPKIAMARLQATPTVAVSPGPLPGNCGSREEKLVTGCSERDDSLVFRSTKRRLNGTPVKTVEVEAAVMDKIEYRAQAVLTVTSTSPALQKRQKVKVRALEDNEDVIDDSEDEGTKNFKARLFMKRYYKTKFNTYIPTLREYLKPEIVRRDLLSPGNGHR